MAQTCWPLVYSGIKCRREICRRGTRSSIRCQTPSSATSIPAVAASTTPTIILEQTLIPFPQYCSVFEPQPAVGTSSYDALQVTYTHRWHSGLDLNLSYTYSKFMDDVQGNSGWAFPGSGTNNLYSYNLAADYSVDASNVPHRFVVSYIYDLPVGKGKHFGSEWSTPVDAVLGGWAWSGILTAESGLPLSIQPAIEQRRFRIQPAPQCGSGRESGAGESFDRQLAQSHAFSQPARSPSETRRGSSRIFMGPRSSIGTWPYKNTGVSRRPSGCNSASRCLTRSTIRTSSSRTPTCPTSAPGISAGSRQPIKRVRRRWRQNSTSDARPGAHSSPPTPGTPTPGRRRKQVPNRGTFRRFPGPRGCAKNEFSGPRED